MADKDIPEEILAANAEHAAEAMFRRSPEWVTITRAEHEELKKLANIDRRYQEAFHGTLRE